MYEHVVIEHLSTAQHSTARHSAISPTQSSEASACPSERDNASKQTELARASMSSSIHTVRCVLKTNAKIEICPAYKVCNPSQSSLAGVVRQGYASSFNFSKIRHCSLSPSISMYFVKTTHAASGLFSCSMELLAFASRQFAPKIVDVAVRFARILLYSTL